MTLRYTVTPVPYSGTFHVELVLSACDELLLRLPAAKSIKARGAYSSVINSGQ